MVEESIITDISFRTVEDKLSEHKSLSLGLDFKLKGYIREVFTQKNWERAYEKQDYKFRIAFNIDIKSGRTILESIKFVHKGTFFWTRSPKIPHRIWITVVKEDTSFYPHSTDEAQSMLFDIKKQITLPIENLKRSGSKIYADIHASWGKHSFIEPVKLSAKSNEIQIN